MRPEPFHKASVNLALMATLAVAASFLLSRLDDKEGALLMQGWKPQEIEELYAILYGQKMNE
jgi:hypothetical protein